MMHASPVSTDPTKRNDLSFSLSIYLQQWWLFVFSFYILATTYWKILFLLCDPLSSLEIILHTHSFLKQWNPCAHHKPYFLAKCLTDSWLCFWKTRYFFLFLHIRLYSLFVFLYSKLPYLSRILDTSTDSS